MAFRNNTSLSTCRAVDYTVRDFLSSSGSFSRLDFEVVAKPGRWEVAIELELLQELFFCSTDLIKLRVVTILISSSHVVALWPSAVTSSSIACAFPSTLQLNIYE